MIEGSKPEQTLYFNANDPCIVTLKQTSQHDVSAVMLLNVLSEHKNPALNFMACDLDAQSLRSLFTTLKRTPWVKRLDLVMNDLTDEALIVIAENIFETSIESLSIEQNNFTAEGLVRLCDTISQDERSAQLHELSLKNNLITSQAWILILHLLKHCQIALDVSLMLPLADSKPDALYLKRAITNSEIVSLNIGYNHLDENSLEVIFDHIHKSAIQSLDISYNSATPAFLAQVPQKAQHSNLLQLIRYNQPARLQDKPALDEVMVGNKEAISLASLGECFSKGRYLETLMPHAPDEIADHCISFFATGKMQEKYIWQGYRKQQALRRESMAASSSDASDARSTCEVRFK